MSRIREEIGFGSNYTLRLDGNSSNYVLSTSNILVSRIREEVSLTYDSNNQILKSNRITGAVQYTFNPPNITSNLIYISSIPSTDTAISKNIQTINGEYIISTSSTFATSSKLENIFDNDSNTSWRTSANSYIKQATTLIYTTGANFPTVITTPSLTINGEWIQVKFPKRTCVSNIIVLPFGTTPFANSIKKWYLLGTNNPAGTNWIVVYSNIETLFTTTAERSLLGTGTNITQYLYYRLVVTEVMGVTADAVGATQNLQILGLRFVINETILYNDAILCIGEPIQSYPAENTVLDINGGVNIDGNITTVGLIRRLTGVVADNVKTDLITMADSTTTPYSIKFVQHRVTSTDFRYYIQQTNLGTDNTNPSLSFKTGYVGIGTTNPTNILQVGSSSRLRIANDTTDYSMIGTNDTDGTTNTKIIISGNTRASVPGNIEYITTSTGKHIFYTGGNVERLRITEAGKVGVGTATPVTSAVFHIEGNLFVNGAIDASGDISAYNNLSDDRLKIRIANINEPLKIIDKLNGFYYKVNELGNSYGIKNTEIEIGLSAQEVNKVLPEVVKLAPFDRIKDIYGNNVSKSGENYLTIAYEKLVPVFVEAIKELQKENKDLKQKYEYILEEIALIKKNNYYI